MTDLNANISECILKADGLIATKVTNISTGATEWVYFPPSIIAVNILMIGILVGGLAFIAAMSWCAFND